MHRMTTFVYIQPQISGIPEIRLCIGTCKEIIRSVLKDAHFLYFSTFLHFSISPSILASSWSLFFCDYERAAAV